MTAHGVPVLFSDCGGASELCTSSMFHFKGGDVEDFLKQLTYLTEHREKIQEFWIYHSGLTTMKKHIDEISAFYKLPEKPTAKLSLEDYSLLLEENEFLTKYFNGENRAVYDNQNTVTKELFDRIQQERDYLQYSLDETRKSVTYKIGRAITAIPRKIKSNLK